MRAHNLLPCLIATIIALAMPGSTSLAQQASDVIQARWKPARVTYTHKGFNAAYECNTVDDIIRIILVRFGAHPNTKVELRGCPDQHAALRFGVIVTTAVAVPTETLGEGQSGHSAEPTDVDELREQLELGEADKAFMSHEQTVRLADIKPQILTGFHCELIENIAKQLLPELGIETLRAPKYCAPDYAELRPPALEARVLVARMTDETKESS